MKLPPEHPTKRRATQLGVELLPSYVGRAVIGTPIERLRAHGSLARVHSEKQIASLMRSIQNFGFTMPVLATVDGEIIAGNARVEAARRLGMTVVPALLADGMTPDQIRAYRLADNRLAELASWNEDVLKIELQHLLNVELDFGLEAIGWDQPDIDFIIGGAETKEKPERDILPPTAPVSRVGDLWRCGRHRLLAGSALDALAAERLMNGLQARMMISDPPWNVRIKGHVSGLGKNQHREFVQASGEMIDAEFQDFLNVCLKTYAPHCMEGAILEIFIDWRGLDKVLAAAKTVGLDLINLCVWNKTNGGMGSFYRSKHELIPIFKKPGAAHLNNIDLGKHGRYRTNVWDAPGCNSFNAERDEALKSHPTCKPVTLIAEAIRDVSNRGDIVLDPFMGSGTTLVAAEQTGRVAYGSELDPGYIDVALLRWQELTGESATLDGTGQTFAKVKAERLIEAQSAAPNVRQRPRPSDQA